MYLYVTLAAPCIAYIAFKIYQKWSNKMCDYDIAMNDKVVIITGANTGIGYETAKDLARRGARVILACRDEARGTSAVNKIIAATGSDKILFKQLDLSSFASIRKFADDILKTESAIHVLINNAGTGSLDNSLTEDNLPIETQVNHFGPFLLTKLLLPLIKSSAPSRIINVSSILHKIGKVDVESFHKPAETSLQHMRVYSNTKLANILFTIKLSKDLKDSGVTVNSLHPGAVHTDIFNRKPWLVQLMVKLLYKSPYEGAQTSIYLAVDPKLKNVTGKYFVNCCEAATSKSACDFDVAEKLWDLSEKAVLEAKKTI